LRASKITKKIFRDFFGKYHVSERSFDQITRILGILGEVHGVVDVAMQEKDREFEKLKELLEIKENSLHENTGSGLSPRREHDTMMKPAMQEYKQLLELCKRLELEDVTDTITKFSRELQKSAHDCRERDIDKYVTGKLEEEQDNNQATAELAHFGKYKHIFQPKAVGTFSLIASSPPTNTRTEAVYNKYQDLHNHYRN
jgi:hypothetical protein